MNIFEWYEKYKETAHVYKVVGVDSQISRQVVTEFKESLSNEKIVLWCAGTVGRIFYSLLTEMGISVAAVVDANGENEKFDQHVHILTPSEAVECIDFTNVLVIATVNRSKYDEVYGDINKYVKSDVRVICGHDIHMIAQHAWCHTKTTGGQKIVLKNCYECTNLDNQCLALNGYLKKMNGFVDEGKGTDKVRMLGYALSNICTLKCKNCCECVPFMPSSARKFTSYDQIIADIDKLSRACNFITLIEFIGGEPFLHPDFHRVLYYVKKIKNIGIIHIFTNGTVIPSNDLCNELKDERISVYISNYQATLKQEFLDKIQQTRLKLQQNDITFFFGKKQNWMDFSQFDLVNSDEELEQVFEDCFLHNCNRLQDGSLYVCAHQYAGIKRGLLNENDEVLHIHKMSDDELEHALEVMKSWKTIDACRYCTMPYKAETVISGEQL